MSAPTRVQDSGIVAGGGVTSIDLPLTSPAAGNMIVVLAIDYKGNRTLTISDFAGNTGYQPPGVIKVNSSSFRSAQISSEGNHFGWSGTHNVTVAGSVPGNNDISAVAIEVNGQDTSPLDATGSNEETVGIQSHASDSVGIDTVANVIVFACGVLNVDDRPYTPGTNFTALGDDGFLSFFQYRTSTSALIHEAGVWDSGTSLRVNTGVIASFKAASGTKFLLMRP